MASLKGSVHAKMSTSGPGLLRFEGYTAMMTGQLAQICQDLQAAMDTDDEKQIDMLHAIAIAFSDVLKLALEIASQQVDKELLALLGRITSSSHAAKALVL